ncbi:coiled-coil domain-containing protein 117 [Chanos chanos]|uniref:Coiled-coil domain-containing protein 117 n=1 Tax=Chanos chanos TaxID=29144 RepID=A0A6J2WTW0_CHACN|nr:coiled-coil domain-containing protein 117 [Chanos chanos]
MTNASWEKRCVRKYKRRMDDEGCSAKRRRLMGEESLDQTAFSGPKATEAWSQDWSSPAHSAQPGPATQQMRPSFSPTCAPPTPLSAPPRPYAETSSMEVEAAQRRLQEIEDRITLEDDDDEEELDVEPAQRRPVLVMSDSLKQGLQQGIGDILPHKVAQSVSRSCMELVLWRPPEDTFTRQLKDSLQRQRKQQAACRQTPTPVPGTSPSHAPSPDPQPTDTSELQFTPMYGITPSLSPGEEEMEL